MTKYPAVTCAVFFAGGIIINEYVGFNYYLQLITLIVTILLTGWFLFLRKSLKNPLIILFLLLLLVMGGNFNAEVNNYKINLIPRDVIKEENFTAYGRIEEINLIREEEISYKIMADSFSYNNILFRGSVRLIGVIRSGSRSLQDSLYSQLNPGYLIVQKGLFIKGRERRNPGEFNYNEYLRKNGISGILISGSAEDIIITDRQKDILKTVIHEARKAIDNKIRRLHNEETSALLRGLILADRSGIDYERKVEFINAGVMHVLAVSGLHTGYVALIFLILLGRFNIVSRSLLTILGLFGFLLISGMPVSVFRAVIMGSLFIAAVITNRTTNIYNGLAAAAIIILIIDPAEIYNPGFQLSFAAVFSIALLYPVFNKLIAPFLQKYTIIRSFLLFSTLSLAAQIGTLPLTVYYFGKLSLIAIIANLVVIPLVGFIVAVSAVTLISSVFIFGLAEIYASSNDFLSTFLFEFTKYSGQLEIAFLRVNNFSVQDVIIVYFLLGCLYWLLPKVKIKAGLIIFILMTANAIVFASLDNKNLLKKGRLSILMIDVGQGDSFLINSPDGITFLIDAGEANKNYDCGERVIIPLLDYLDIGMIDYAFITHLDLDHYGGMVSLIKKKRIRHLLKAPADGTTEDQKLENFLKFTGQEYSSYRKGMLSLNNLRIYCMSNNDEINYRSLSSNDKSGVLKVVYGNTSFLFTGDIHHQGEKYYSDNYGIFLKSDLLKISHHGSKSSTSEDFIKLVDPDFAFISAGYKNRFKHPSPEVLERLSGIKKLRTDLTGAVLVQSDGNNIKEVVWK